MVLIRRATINDLNGVFEIYNDAVEKFAVEKTYQWVKGYPSIETFKNDLEVNNVFVVIKENNIVGVMTVLTEDELDYNEIEGSWLNCEKYFTVHRIAVKKEALGMGIGSMMIEYVKKLAADRGIYNIKIDTHKLNFYMKRLLEKRGFKLCGFIKLRNKNFDLRYAYQYCGD